jgi:AcrR family transcriptional regulator
MRYMPVDATREHASPKQKLLEGAIAFVTERGVSELSLRELAVALGTSHRMLIYHFGSKEGLLVEVVQTIEQRERATLAQLLDSEQSLTDAARAFWMRVSDPALAPYERLFFEVYGQGLQGHEYARPLLDGIIDSWLDAVSARLVGQGVRESEVRARARLGVAVVRGLLLDLLATGERAEVDAAFEQYLAGLAVDRGALM